MSGARAERPLLLSGLLFGRLFRVVTAGFFSLCVAFGLDPTLALTQYVHTSWNARQEAALEGIYSIAQTPSGYIWVATASGVVRFDGVRFVAIPLEGVAEDPAILGMIPARGAGMWIATATGVSKYDENGRLIRQAYPTTLRKGSVSLLEDGTGRLWVGRGRPDDKGLAVIEPDGKVRPAGTTDFEGRVLALAEDGRGGVLVGGVGSFCRFEKAVRVSCVTDPMTSVKSFSEDAGGNLILADTWGKQILRRAGERFTPVLSQINGASLAINMMRRDRDGNLWLATLGQGLVRIGKDSVERFTRRDGLTSDSLSDVLEDREGNLWVASINGLERFCDPKIDRLSTPKGLGSELVNAVMAGHDDAIWIGTAAGLDRWSAGKIQHFDRGQGLPGSVAIHLFEDSRQALWVATTSGLARSSGGRFTVVEGVHGERLDRVYGMTENSEGVWVADEVKGVFRVTHEGAERYAPTGLAEGGPVACLLGGRGAELWLGFHGGGVAEARAGNIKLHSSEQGVAGVRARKMSFDAAGTLWVASAGGLGRYRNGQWTNWTAAQGLTGGVLDVADDGQSSLWLLTPGRVLRISHSQLDAIPDGAPRPLDAVGLTVAQDASLGRSVLLGQQMARSGDGRLWFATTDGLAYFDPKRAGRQRAVPPVVIEAIDGNPVAGPVTSLRTHSPRIEYTALTLSEPEKVRFQYMLEGLDSTWSQETARREVVFANLAPGDYRFRVRASSHDGFGNEAGVSMPFRIQPYFYQTIWFRGMSAVTFLLMIGAIYRWREHQLKARFALVLAERNRLTRDLHDTLLQGFAGAVFQMEAARRKWEADPEASKSRLEHALELADDSLKEARQTIAFMRQPRIEQGALPEILETTGRQLVEETGIAFELKVSGKQYTLAYDTQWNLYVIAREAMINATKHAQAKHLALELTYSPAGIRMAVRDDGRGFNPDEAGEERKRLGLRSMEERAKQIGGKYAVQSRPGAGTTVVLELTIAR